MHAPATTHLCIHRVDTSASIIPTSVPVEPGVPCLTRLLRCYSEQKKPGDTNLDTKIRPSKITEGSIISISPTCTTLFLLLFHSKISKHSTLTQGLLLGSVHGSKFQVEFPSQNNRHHASPTTLPLRDTHRQTVHPTTQSTHPTATRRGLQHRRRRSQQKRRTKRIDRWKREAEHKQSNVNNNLSHCIPRGRS